jgi:hypothetical protein
MGYLWTVGGASDDQGSCSRAISKVCLQPPYAITLEVEMPQPVSFHCLEIIGDDLIIIGGSKT